MSVESSPQPASAHVIVLGSHKDGAGKSTIAMHVAVALLNFGQRVATIDLDAPRQTLTQYIAHRRAAGSSELRRPTHLVSTGGSRLLVEVSDSEVTYELPADGNRRADMSLRVPKTREQLEEVEAAGLWQRPASVDRLLEAAEGLPPSDAVAVVHGDLHFRQVLVGDDGSPAGVIDWVDVCRSDPAIDLSMLWSYLPSHGRAAYLTDPDGHVVELWTWDVSGHLATIPEA